jgi:hypothetical protein
MLWFRVIFLFLTLIGGRQYPFLVKGGTNSDLNGRDRRVARKSKSYNLFMVAFFLLTSSYLASGQPQENPKQEVTVTAVEVPVRVLRGGEIVRDLKKEDFEIFENGVKQEISVFETISRRIAGPKPGAVPATVAVKPKPRLFILIFYIFDYTDAVGEAIDYFFSNVYRNEDHLVLVTESRILNFDAGRDAASLARNLKDSLKRYKAFSTKNILKAYDELREEGDRPLSEPSDIIRFYDNYIRIWRLYRAQFLALNPDLYQALLKRIQPIAADRWALCFLQRNLFPELRNEGRLEQEINRLKEGAIDPQEQVKARLIQAKQWELQQEFDLTKNFPADTLKNLFMEGGVTFHLILMKSLKSLVSEDFVLREVNAEFEDCFREISRSTGGYLTFSNKVLDALKEASENEDYHYLLVYAPKGPVETRGKNIEVKVRQQGVKIYSLKEYLNLASPVITITDVSARSKALKFGLKNYAMLSGEKGKRGIAEVHVTLYDSQSNAAFSEGKILDLVKDELNITLNLGKLQAGPYFLIIEVVDKITNEKDVFSRMIEL